MKSNWIFYWKFFVDSFSKGITSYYQYSAEQEIQTSILYLFQVLYILLLTEESS